MCRQTGSSKILFAWGSESIGTRRICVTHWAYLRLVTRYCSVAAPTRSSRRFGLIITATHMPRVSMRSESTFSHSSLQTAAWNNSTIVRGDVAAEVTKLTQQDGGDLLVLGHGLLGETLLRRRLIDVLDLSIVPVIVGRQTVLPRGPSRKTEARCDQEFLEDRQGYL